MKEIEIIPISPRTQRNSPASIRSDPGWIQFTPPWESSAKTGVAAPPPFVPLADRKVTVIIADDDLVSREEVSGMVKKWGFHIVVANDGYEALAAIHAEPGPVVAILDWMMPGMDGLQICRRGSGEWEIGAHHFVDRALSQREPGRRS